MDTVFVGAQRRITLTTLVPGNRAPQTITFWPGRVTRCPREVWESLKKKKQSPRQDMADQRSPIEEYIETGLLWEMNADQANMVAEGKVKAVSPFGPDGKAHRPAIREPKDVEGLVNVGELNSATAETLVAE